MGITDVSPPHPRGLAIVNEDGYQSEGMLEMQDL